MSQQTIEVEVWVLVDAAGDYSVGKEQSAAVEAYENDIQPLADADGYRTVKVTLTVPLPAVVELTGTVPADDATATLAVR